MLFTYLALSSPAPRKNNKKALGEMAANVLLLSTSTGGPQGAQGAEARLGPCNTRQNGPRADSWLRTSRGAIKALRSWQGTLRTQPPSLPKSPTAPQAARVAHHDFGRPGAGPPGPLPALLGPPAGAGGPTAGRCGPSEAPRGPDPLHANYDNRYENAHNVTPARPH